MLVMATHSQLIDFPISLNNTSQYTNVFYILSNASFSIGGLVKISLFLLTSSLFGVHSAWEVFRYLKHLPQT